MNEKITLCGDNCMKCPRYNAHTEEELRAVAELWCRVGWRDHVVSGEEIACTGCSSHNGRIAERGCHETLLEQQGVYQKLWTAQAEYYKDTAGELYA